MQPGRKRFLAWCAVIGLAIIAVCEALCIVSFDRGKRAGEAEEKPCVIIDKGSYTA
jgi:hypothetical protein